jgi:molybdenum cofactor biosynthesis enzyme MoaA
MNTAASQLIPPAQLLKPSRDPNDYLREVAPGLPEFSHYQPAPGHPDWARLQDEARALARQLEPGLARPESTLARARRYARSYRTALANYRENWRRARAGREDLLPLYFIWTTLRTCNFACSYCDDHRGQKYPDLCNDDVLDTEGGTRLLRVMRTRTPSVYFAGGEPTLRKDLPQLTRAARDMSYAPIVINTNGSVVARRLADPAWSTWLADTDIVIVSVDALDLNLLKGMWDYKRPHEVLRNLLLLRELRDSQGFKLMINLVIQPGSIPEARAVFNLARDLDIWLCPVPVNQASGIDHTLQEDPDYAALVDELLRAKRDGARITGSLRLLRRLLRSEPLDCRNTLKPHVDFDGRLAWPCKSTVNVDPEYVNVLEHEHVDSLYAEATARIDPTNFHGPGPEQCGGECNWAQNYSTDAYFHGLTHPASLLRDVVGFLRG